VGPHDEVGPVPPEKVDSLVEAVDQDNAAGRQVRHEKLSVRIARQILRDIRRNGIAAGASLPPEPTMAQDLSIGRGTLREGLRLLEFTGIISIRSGSGGGPLVCAPTDADFARTTSLYLSSRSATVGDLAQARLVLEPTLAGLAARNPTPRAMERLHGTLAQLKEVPPDRHRDFARIGTTLNMTISAMSGNVVLSTMSGGILALWMERISPWIVYSRSQRTRSLTSYEAIIAAIGEGDCHSAEANMHELISKWIEVLLKNYPSVFSEIVDWRT
jgi:GntR family transcriptional regulator, transcriptional repressor for pyruvate dehydrogenase complex